MLAAIAMPGGRAQRNLRRREKHRFELYLSCRPKRIVLKSVFICSGWGLTENGKLPKYLRSVNLKVTRFVRPTGFLETLGGEEGYGACKVIKRQSGTLKVEDSDGGS